MEESFIRFKRYIALKTNFEINSDFDFSKTEVSLKPQFNRSVNKIDEDNYQIILSAKIEKTKEVPFLIDIVIRGDFVSKQWEKSEDNFAVTNATAILFPYLRNTISQMTLNANISPYVIPVMNINQLFLQKK